ncbi:MAG: hypothetical protein VX589_17035 [Myxococcota bacterium]|nr:hypothetical protein [Myxococcota bacterium]
MTSSTESFEAYEQRFVRLIGELKTGQYGQFRGRLVRRLSQVEHRGELTRYRELGQRLEASLMAGDTMDERLTTEIRAAEVTLVLEESQYLPQF